MGGLATSQTTLLFWGASLPGPPPSIWPNMSPIGHDTCTMIIVHTCTEMIVHARTMIVVHACTMIIVHVCTMIIVHACIMIIARACTMIIVHACTMIIVHVSCHAWLMFDPRDAGVFGGPPGAPMSDVAITSTPLPLSSTSPLPSARPPLPSSSLVQKKLLTELP